MSQSIFSILFVSVLSSMSFAFATPKGSLDHQIILTSSKIAPEHMQNVAAGSLKIDYTKKSLTLVLISEGPNCLPGAMCAMYVVAPLIVELPITKIEADPCGILTVTAVEDKRPVDGMYQELKVSDPHQALSCMFVRMPDIKATYKTINPWNNKLVVSKMYLQLTSRTN